MVLRERELQRKNDQLERVTSIITHDIRNPLNVVQARVEIARESSDIDVQLDIIAENADRIEDIIEDALVMTRDGTIQNTESVNVPTVARRAWTHVTTGDVQLEMDSGFSVEGDLGHLLQLFENVFRNAIEHGGDVTVVRVGPTTDDDGEIRGFFIADDGVGIPEENRETVMEDGYTTSEDGIGLGLSIVAETVEMHDWSVEVTESDSGGARFEIDCRTPEEPSSVVTPESVNPH